jgi:RNA 2',3'-cyclic 3'-phosphodiesterase
VRWFSLERTTSLRLYIGRDFNASNGAMLLIRKRSTSLEPCGAHFFLVPSTPAPSLRLFLGLWPDAGTRAALLAHAAAWDWPDAARRTRPERLHVTLHFIGNVAADRLPALQGGLQVDWGGGELVLDQATVWPGGIAVLEAKQVTPSLRALHGALADRLRALDLPLESRPWRPHVTLARMASGAHPPMAVQQVARRRWRRGRPVRR